ncbi:MAG: hypothetical protein JWO77_3771 [Ilumatobacteraceae bacterium]|nr:hypothetical protein [Ilumatobacteraceae bacterium]
MPTSADNAPNLGGNLVTVEDHVAVGKAVRKAVPRSSLGHWSQAQRTHDPVTLLEQQAETRVPDLVPIRHGRMSVSAFANFRGAALMMAADLATTPNTGLTVQLCGDAHLSNFGGFASPERKLVFDLNDFDETLPGPFEWDVKRLVASIDVAGRSNGLEEETRRDMVLGAARSYREAMAQFAAMRDLEVWYSSLDVEAVLGTMQAQADAAQRKRAKKGLAKAHGKDQLRAAAKLTELVDGHLRFIDNPPLLVSAGKLFGAEAGANLEDAVRGSLDSYRESLNADRRHLLGRYRFMDLARKVVGVGSVGTRAWVALFVGRDDDDPLVLQVKEAQRSVLEEFLPASVYATHGQRVVEGQRLMQASSDILLGWQQTDGIDGVRRDYFMRQLWDWKASVEVELLEAPMLARYGELCAWTLARAHARSGDRVAIAAYLGTGGSFDKAMAAFAGAYADQNDRDHAALVAAIADGRLQAQMGI